MSENEGFGNRSPLQRLKGLQIRKPKTSNFCSSSSSSPSSSFSVSFESRNFSSRFLPSSNSSSAASSSSSFSTSSSSKTYFHRKPKNSSREIEVPKKPFSHKSVKTQPPRPEKKQFGKANSKRTIKIVQRSKLCPAQRNPAKILRKGSGKLEGKSKNCEEKGSGELPIKLFRVFDDINLDCVENCTPNGKIASVCGLESVRFDCCQKVNEGLILKTANDENSDSTTVKTPPVEASVSPEIQIGSQSKMQILKSAATPICYGTGYLLSGVSDKRKCRRRGSLKGGCEKFNLSDDENEDENVIPLPAEASVRWVLSPCDEEHDDLEIQLEKCKMTGENEIGESDLLSSPLEHDEIDDNSALSFGSSSSGNIIQTPSSGSSSYGCLGGSNVDFVQFELDSVKKTLNEVGPSISDMRLQCEDLNQVQENANSVCSWVSDSTLENLTLSQTRISWRDGLVSRIDENDDEFDCCRCLSDEEIDADVCCEKQLSPMAQPGGDEENDLALNCCIRSCLGNESGENKENDIRIYRVEHEPCISARGKDKLSPCRLNASAESICTNGDDLVASGDSDWMCFRENYLF